jgi:signal transduction histidine kinase
MVHSVPRGIVLIVLLAVAWLLAGAWLAERSIDVLSQANERDAQNHEVRESLQQLLSAMQDAETGQRGYILTRSLSFLEPYYEANRQIDRLLVRAQELTADSPAQRRSLDQLSRTVAAKREFLSRTIEYEDAGQHARAIAAVSAGTGRQLMSNIRAGIDGMQQEEGRQLASSSAEQQSALVDTQKVLYGYAVLSVLLLGLAIAVSSSELRSANRARLEILGINQQLEQRVRELAELRDAAMAADRAKTAFLATISHELRTPLNAIIGFSGLMLESPAAAIDDVQRKHVDIIHKAGRHLLELVNEVIDITVIEAAQLLLHLESVDIGQVLLEQCDAMRLQARSRNLELKFIDPGESITVRADVQRLRQVITNLVSNALKFTDYGYVHVSIATDGEFARVTVDDTGIGIPVARRAELFVPFRRVRERGDAHREGLGLGLSICLRLIENMGGRIGIDDHPGGGTRFWFTVPRAGKTPAVSA